MSEGLVWVARHEGDPRQKWTTKQIDKFPTSHHLAWADIDGDGKKELMNAPLVGPKSAAPTFDQDKAPIFFYRPTDWKRQTITNDVNGIIHRVRPVSWDGNGRDQLLVASFDGITLYRANGRGDDLKWRRSCYRLGTIRTRHPASARAMSRLVSRAASGSSASVEPWHGTEIVVYADRSGKWERKVIFSGLTEGHTRWRLPT